MEDLFNWLVNTLRLEDTSNVSMLILVSLLGSFFGKLIPDDKKGVLGFVRNVCKAAGLYVSNRISSGVSVSDVARSVEKSGVADADLVLARRPDGRFKKIGESGFAGLDTMLWLGVLAFVLAACIPRQERVVVDITDAVCKSVPTAQMALDAAADSRSKDRVQKLLDFLGKTCPLVLAQLDLRKADSAGVLPIDTD